MNTVKQAIKMWAVRDVLKRLKKAVAKRVLSDALTTTIYYSNFPCPDWWAWNYSR